MVSAQETDTGLGYQSASNLLIGSREAGGVQIETVFARLGARGSFENDGSDAIPLPGSVSEQSFTLRNVIPAHQADAKFSSRFEIKEGHAYGNAP